MEIVPGNYQAVFQPARGNETCPDLNASKLIHLHAMHNRWRIALSHDLARR